MSEPKSELRGRAIEHRARLFVIQHSIVAVIALILVIAPYGFSVARSMREAAAALASQQRPPAAIAPPARVWGTVGCIAWPCIVGGACLLIRVRLIRIVRRVDRCGGLACTKCMYDLSSLPDHGACPECGEAYTHESVRVQWSHRGW